MKHRLSLPRSESGQVLVLVVLAAVALLGFAALAIDGSMLYSDRRYAQNSADSIALAGGAAASQWMATNGITASNWNCGSLGAASTTAKTTAVARAAQNGFVISSVANEASLPDPKMGVYTVCNQAGRYLDIHTWISHDTPTAFAHFAFQGLLRNTVESVVRLRPPTNLAFGNAIVALNPAGCSGINTGAGFTGNSEVNVYGGGVFSNGCLRANNNADVNVCGAGVSYNYLKGDLGSFNLTTCDGVTGTFTDITDEQRMPAEAYSIPIPDCSQAVYQGSWPPSNMSGNTLPAGLYCISGGITIHTRVVGTGVTIYMTDGSAFKMNAQATADLAAPDPSDGNAPVNGAVEGLLFFIPGGGNVTINGGSTSNYQGTILAPNSWVKLNGGSDISAYHTQVIGWDIQVAGGNGTNVWYDSNVLFQIPMYIDLWK